jgi:hypothetical protein
MKNIGRMFETLACSSSFQFPRSHKMGKKLGLLWGLRGWCWVDTTQVGICHMAGAPYCAPVGTGACGLILIDLLDLHHPVSQRWLSLRPSPYHSCVR